MCRGSLWLGVIGSFTSGLERHFLDHGFFRLQCFWLGVWCQPIIGGGADFLCPFYDFDRNVSHHHPHAFDITNQVVTQLTSTKWHSLALRTDFHDETYQ